MRVLNKDNGRPVLLAYVNVYDAIGVLQSTVQTDDSGATATIITAYPCRIEAVAMGYEPASQVLRTQPETGITMFIRQKTATINEVVVTGLAAPVARNNALNQYRVITKAEMQAQGNITLADALATQLNMNVGNDAVLGANINMQGMEGNKVKVLIDGMPVNGREAGNIDLGQINLNNIERIEIVQGPMSVVYGTDAVAGVINLITKKSTKAQEFQMGINYESIEKYNLDASAGMRIAKRHQLSLGGARNFFRGWKFLDTTEVQRVLLFKPKEQYIGNLAYTYTAPSGFNLSLASDLMREKVTNRGTATIDPFSAFGLDEYYRTTRSQTRLFASGKLGKKGTWNLQNSYAYYYRTKNKYSKNLVTLNEVLTQNPGDQDTSTFQDVNARGSYTNSVGRLTYTAGYDINAQYGYSLKIRGNAGELQDYAAFANLTLPLANNKLTLQGGVRAAYNTGYRAPITPSLNLLYNMSKTWQLRASYARGFRAPSLKEQYLEFIDINHHIVGNPDLQAEYAHHGQLSVSKRLYERQRNYLQLMLTGYYNDVENLITLVNNDPANPFSVDYTYGNIARQRNTIATLQTEGHWNGLQASIGYSYTYVLAQPGLNPAFSANELNATIQYSWKQTGLTFSVFDKLLGAQPRLVTDVTGISAASYSNTVPAYNMLDASIERSFFEKRLQLIVGVKNILDVQNISSAGVGTGSTGGHGGGVAGMAFLPRRIFTTLRVMMD